MTTNYPQQDYEKDKAILANAPDGATHFVLHNGTNYFFKIESLLTCIWTDEWMPYMDSKKSLPDLDNVRHMTDIRTNIALYEQWKYYQDLLKENGFEGITDLLAQHKKANARIAELESQLAPYLTSEVLDGMLDIE